MEKRTTRHALRAMVAGAACVLMIGACAAAGVSATALAEAVADDADDAIEAEVEAEPADEDAAELTMMDIIAIEGVSAATGGEADPSDAFNMNEDCASCHKKATKKMNKEGYTGSIHASLACISCHDDEEALTEAHASEKYTAKKGDKVVALVHTDSDDEVCFACHGTMEELAETTADSTVLTDKNGTTVNPHDLPEGHYGNMVTCGKCHKMHDTKTIEESATNACLGCHHDNVYECGTCHSI